jgi:hypothetical protein
MLANNNLWAPFESRIKCNFTHYHFVEVQNSASKIDQALDIWMMTLLELGRKVPWKNVTELYANIGAIQHGNSPWKVYKL